MNTLNVKNRTLFTGDNLNIMRGIDTATIDLIYLDPPFNSNRNYAAPIGSEAAGAVFKDTWTLDDIKQEWVESLELENKALWAAITSAGYVHGESMQAYLTYMAIRLIEINRILKDTGSIYLHCDPTASHYLKLVMDSVFRKDKFRREITWSNEDTSGFKSKANNWIRVNETLFYYIKSKNYTFNKQYLPLDEKTTRRYDKIDEDGKRFKIYKNKDGSQRRSYLKKDRGASMGSAWTDIPSFQKVNNTSENTGYPTQKPLALLERIIKASSNKGDVVLDPFCGCATTCVAAEKLERQWIGIDIEPKARDLVISRLEKEVYNNALLQGGRLPKINHKQTAPKRTDTDAPKRSKNIKQKLYKQQEGRCNLPCEDGKVGREIPFDLLEIDHIKPKSKDGPDVDDNLQLLCATCNRKKGNKTMQYMYELLYKEHQKG